jgi:hypothetical protein
MCISSLLIRSGFNTSIATLGDSGGIPMIDVPFRASAQSRPRSQASLALVELSGMT